MSGFFPLDLGKVSKTSNERFGTKPGGSFTEPKGRSPDANWSQEVEGKVETRKLFISFNSPFFLPKPAPASYLHTLENTASNRIQVYKHLKKHRLSLLTSFQSLRKRYFSWPNLDQKLPLGLHCMTMPAPLDGSEKAEPLFRDTAQYVAASAISCIFQGGKAHYKHVLVLTLKVVHSEA